MASSPRTLRYAPWRMREETTMRDCRVFAVALALFAGTVVAASAQPSEAAPPSKLVYPPARRAQTVDTYFGTDVPAPYQWMEDLDSPAVKQWVEAENKLTLSYLDKVPVRELDQDAPDEALELRQGQHAGTGRRQADLLPQELGPAESVRAVRAGFARRRRPASCSIPTPSRRTARSRCSATSPPRAAMYRRLQPLAGRIRLAHHPRARRRYRQGPARQDPSGSSSPVSPGPRTARASSIRATRSRPRQGRSASASSTTSSTTIGSEPSRAPTS